MKTYFVRSLALSLSVSQNMGLVSASTGSLTAEKGCLLILRRDFQVLVQGSLTQY